MNKDTDALAFELICQIGDMELAKQLTEAVADALMAKYRKGLDDGSKIAEKHYAKWEKGTPKPVWWSTNIREKC